MAVLRSALRREGNCEFACQVLPGDRPSSPRHLVERPLDDDLAALHAGTGTEVHDGVGGPHGVLVVLDHDHGVAQVAQVAQRLQQLVIVARMQPDAWLVEDVQHADQPAPNLAGQPDPLRLAAGQARRRAVQRQVVQPDVEQEVEPGADLLQAVFGDGRLRPVQPQLAEELRSLTHGRIAHLRKSAIREAHCSGFGAEAVAVALRAGMDGHQRLDLRFEVRRPCPGVPVHDVGEDAAPPVMVTESPLPVAVLEVELQTLIATAVQQGVLLLLGEVSPAGLQGEAEGVAHPFVVVLQPVRAPHQAERVLAEGAIGVFNQALWVDLVLGA